ncbi:hypothetical protein [Mesorhizobium australicum]|uniref:hypothetical protein n=1 Tax=Mesorhizobium australicum TaxID=536018 RepID=UPI00111C2ED5|nr:hypothetical protein [Mesorhizobium australicum]
MKAFVVRPRAVQAIAFALAVSAAPAVIGSPAFLVASTLRYPFWPRQSRSCVFAQPGPRTPGILLAGFEEWWFEAGDFALASAPGTDLPRSRLSSQRHPRLTDRSQYRGAAADRWRVASRWCRSTDGVLGDILGLPQSRAGAVLDLQAGHLTHEQLFQRLVAMTFNTRQNAACF